MKRLATNSQHLIAVSEYTKQRLISYFGIDPCRITVIYSGVSESFSSAVPEQSLAACHALSLPSRDYFLSLGSLEPRKNIRRLLAAWASVVNIIPGNIWLVVAGSGDNIYADTNLHAPPRTYFTGYVPASHLVGLYSGSMALVYPSLGEGFGFPPLEAMACGTPVITSKTTALPEVCQSAALYVDPNDTDDIASAILRLTNHQELRLKLSEEGRRRASYFSWKQTADQTWNVLLAESLNQKAFLNKTSL